MNSFEDVLLRDADPSDIPALAELHARTFNETHGRGPDHTLRERQWREKFAKSDLLLFCVVMEARDGHLIGFASGQPNLSEELASYRGELNKIYLLRDYHGRGLGRLLLCAAAQRFLRRGITSMLLFGDARSPSNGFHEAMGGERLLSPTGAFDGGYGWRDLQKLAERCPPSSSKMPV